MLSFSCEKEQLATTSSLAEEDAALIEAVNFQPHGPAPAYQSLAEIPINLQNGTLEFEDLVEFRRALNTLAKASNTDYQAWAIGAGFNSPYLEYLRLREQIKINQGPLKPSVLTAEQVDFLLIDTDGVPRFKLPYFELMKIISLEDGTFKIGSTINYYTPDRHFIIPNNQSDVLGRIQSDPLADYSADGVIIERIEVQKKEEPNNDFAKVERANFICPVGLSTGNGANTRTGITIRELEDERTIEGNRQRLTSRLTFINSLVFLAGSERDILQRLTVEYDNERRSWFTWIGTQPGTSFAQEVDFNTPTPLSAGPVSDAITLSRNLRVFRIYNGGPLAGFVNVFDVNGPISEANSATFTVERDDSEGSGLFDDFSFSYLQPLFVTESDFDLSYFMADGTARVFWSGRDTNSDLDHVSGDFNCN